MATDEGVTSQGRARGWADSAVRGDLHPAALAGLALGALLIMWLAWRVVRVVLKVASVLATLSALAGVVMYFLRRDRDDDFLEDEN